VASKTVACVLRSGGCYDAEDVARLRDGVSRFLPGARFVCFSDVPVPCERIALSHDWPGWWAKMELFCPHKAGDLLYFDLDTMFVGPLDDVAAVRGPAIMRDVYRPAGLQSSMMHIPQSTKAEIWRAFISDPAGHMARHAIGGDQTFLEQFWSDKAARWQDVCPGRVVSYKVDGVKPGASVVIFHGAPKPRDLGWKLT
jgi:hypothetical protein